MEALFFIVVLPLTLAFEISIIVLIAWLIGRAANRDPKTPEQISNSKQVQVERGSLSLVSPGRLRSRPIASSLAIIAGILGTIGFVMYWVGPFAGDGAIGFIGMGLAILGSIAAGVIYGTDDRDFYL